MIVKAGLLVDFGNSGTRVYLLTGAHAFRFNMSNKYVDLPAGYKVNSKYANEKSTVFEFNGQYFANGLLVEREFIGKEIRPSALQSKTEQLVTDLTLNLAIIKALNLLALAHNTPVAALDITFNVSVLLPPLDHEVNESKMVDLINKQNHAKTLLPVQIDAKFKIGDVVVHSEAVSAFFGAFYREDGLKVLPQNEGKSLRKGDVLVRDNGNHVSLVDVEKNLKFATGYTLVLDIGAGTTDVALFLDMELVENSKDTFTRGGNTVESVVRNEIKKKFGFVPTNLQRVIAEGILVEGNEEHDVKEIVTLAKEMYSRTTKEDITQYLERMSISMQLVKGLLVAGGGSLATKRFIDAEGNFVMVLEPVNPTDAPKISIKGQVYNDSEVPYNEVEVSPAMSEVLMNFLKELAPRMEVLDTEGKDLRGLNIEGLLFLHKYQ
jgi:hypothetical protein